MQVTERPLPRRVETPPRQEERTSPPSYEEAHAQEQDGERRREEEIRQDHHREEAEEQRSQEERRGAVGGDSTSSDGESQVEANAGAGMIRGGFPENVFNNFHQQGSEGSDHLGERRCSFNQFEQEARQTQQRAERLRMEVQAQQLQREEALQQLRIEQGRTRTLQDQVQRAHTRQQDLELEAEAGGGVRVHRNGAVAAEAAGFGPGRTGAHSTPAAGLDRGR